MTARARINVTELRQNLPRYLTQVRRGSVLDVTSRGVVIAQLMPAADDVKVAQAELQRFRAHCRIGDIESPVDVTWNADKRSNEHARR
ncbi:MAG: type II toxin-antitoxin system prevent-host-death family antitoxin [bacterium]